MKPELFSVNGEQSFNQKNLYTKIVKIWRLVLRGKADSYLLQDPSRRKFLRNLGTFAATTTFILNTNPNELLGRPSSTLPSEKTTAELQLSPERTQLLEELRVVSEAWNEYGLDELLDRTISAGEYFSLDRQKYLNRDFGKDYQSLFQTIDFFVDIQKLVKAFAQDPQHALKILESADHIDLITFKNITVPMFTTLSKFQDIPQEQREARIAAEYQEQRIKRTKLGIPELISLMQKDGKIYTELETLINNYQKKNPGLIPKKIGGLIYNELDTEKGPGLSKSDLLLIEQALRKFTEDYGGFSSMAVILEPGLNGEFGASFNLVEGKLRINYMDVVNQLYDVALEHEILGHGSPVDGFDNWDVQKNKISSWDRFAHWDPRLLLESSQQKIAALIALLNKKDYVIECTMPNSSFNKSAFISAEEKVALNTSNLYKSDVDKNRILETLSDETFSILSTNEDVAGLVDELGIEITRHITDIVRKNVNNYVTLVDQLLAINKNNKPSKKLQIIIAQLIEDILHFHIDIHIDYCNQYCNLRDTDMLGETGGKYPLFMDVLSQVDPRQVAAFNFFKSRVLLSKTVGAPLISDQGIFLSFAESRLAMTNACEQLLLSQFELTKAWKIREYSTVNNLLIKVAKLAFDYDYSPYAGRVDDPQMVDELWRKLSVHIPNLVKNILFIHKNQSDEMQYQNAVSRLIDWLIYNVGVNATGAFFEYCKTAANDFPEIKKYMTELNEMYSFYLDIKNNSDKTAYQNEVIANVGKYLTMRTAPLIFAYDMETGKLEPEIFLTARAYFDKVTDTSHVQDILAVMKASKTSVKVIKAFSNTQLWNLTISLKKAEALLENVKNFAVPDKEHNNAFSFNEIAAEKAAEYINETLESVINLLGEIEEPDVTQMIGYFIEIQGYLINSTLDVSIKEESIPLFQYLIYRTRLALDGALDSLTILDRISAATGDNVPFPKLGDNANNPSWSIAKNTLPLSNG